MALDALGGTEFEPYDYQTSIKRRLQTIAGMGEGMSEQIRQQKQLESMRRQAAEMQRLSGMNPVGTFRNIEGGGSYGSAGSPTGSVGAFIRAIAGQESGGNYGAVNASSGALGKYQIMPSNVSAWSREALGRSVSTQQFLRDPNLQERVAQYMLSKYYKQYGPQGAAAAWYGGPGVARNWSSNTRSQGAYPSIANYVNAVMARMR
jgi:hypothetical protein